MTEIQMHGLSTFDAPGADMPAARATNGAMVSAMIRFGQRYGESLSLLGQEMLDFSRAQLSRDAAVALSLACCRDWSEASRIQQDWMRAAVGDYAAQMQRLFRLAVKATMDACRPLPERADAALGATGASA